MKDLISSVKESLSRDIVSYGELRQIIEDDFRSNSELFDDVRICLRELLLDDVGIGDAVDVKGEYVKFVAWKGPVPNRVNRALHAVSEAKGFDSEFSFWLCLSCNIDEFEAEC